jgi:FPC/CPF motif-containing protein YcgG
LKRPQLPLSLSAPVRLRISIDTCLHPVITRHSRGWAPALPRLCFDVTRWIFEPCSQSSAPAANNTASRKTRC